jgi:hypothetical protein
VYPFEGYRHAFIDAGNCDNFATLARLRQRFEWVLEFVETGCLPSEAQTGEEVLSLANEPRLPSIGPFYR